MTKCAATCKNMADSHEQENIEEGATTLGSDARTVRKLTGEAATLGSDVRTVRQPTGETPGAQSVRNVTGTVTEGRRVEETPPNTWEQVLQCLSPERCEVTGESSNHTGKVLQWEATEESSQDHTSDQEETKDKESLSEVNWSAHRLEFIREFQEIMNEAIEQLLNKPVRRHSRWKEGPEPCTEQGKCKETIHKEAERLPQYDVNRESDDKWNSIVSQETMDTDQCIQRLVRSELEGSDHAQCKTENTTQYWVMKEKEVVTNYCHVLELNKSVSDKRVQQLYSQDQTQEVINQAERQAALARWILNNIWRVEEAGLSRNSPNYPGTPRVNNRHKNARNDMQVSYRESHEWITQPVQVIVPDAKRYWSPEAETAVYPTGDHEYHDPIMCMVCSTLEESWDDNPDESIIAWMRLNISPPEEYSGSSDLKVYEMFVAGILQWAKTTWSFRC